VGAEGLIRWQHPERGLVAPGAFIGVAEESELIVPMGHWVLRTACEQLAAWQGNPRLQHLQLSVNVSARQFRQRDFVARVVEVLRETGARPHLLKLELTESLVLDNVDDTIAKIGTLKTKGVRFSVDDFGTGYSSLAYLTRLPLDQLKIDQSFVHNLGVRHTDDVIVQTILGMARNLELDVIAEGVETEAQKKLLAQYGCTYFQGYLLGRPVPVAELEALLEPAAVAAEDFGLPR
jgi:EAL domain-containing protein (putative c-di-GMP-specific phosphodiesterase class I)